MMADVALAYPSGMSLSDRLSSMHAAELQGFVTKALTRWGKPVWVVGTSNGSVSAVTAAGFTSVLSGLRGVVLTSTVTRLSATDQPTCNLYVSRITVQTLVVWNKDDHCTASPPLGSAALFAAFHRATRLPMFSRRPFGSLLFHIFALAGTSGQAHWRGPPAADCADIANALESFFQGLPQEPGQRRVPIDAPDPQYVADYLATADGHQLAKMFMKIPNPSSAIHRQARRATRSDRRSVNAMQLTASAGNEARPLHRVAPPTPRQRQASLIGSPARSNSSSYLWNLGATSSRPFFLCTRENQSPNAAMGPVGGFGASHYIEASAKISTAMSCFDHKLNFI